MSSKRIKNTIQDLLAQAGVKIGGKRPWDIRVTNEKFYARVLTGASLTLGESYIDGWWECEAVDQFIDRVLRARLDTKIKAKWIILWNKTLAMMLNQQNKSKAKVVGRRHYDLGNELYKNMLDAGMNYSCGYWRNADTLDSAQDAKLDLICKKLNLKPGQTVLDIGCGWGGFAKFAAEKYQAKVTGITISQEQATLAKKLTAGLNVDIRLQDYRDITEKFDNIVSIGMFEHVGYKNYLEFMKVASQALKNNGLFLLHTIGNNISVKNTEPWMEKYIFPHSQLPSASQITKAAEGIFMLMDWHSFGTHYDKTLMAWHKNFNKNWDIIKTGYDGRFKRMWNYYLLSNAGSFRAQKNQLWQIVLAKIGSQIKYKSIR